jgi:hypothetical protein
VLRDDVVRNGVVSVLDRAGWTWIEQPTGFHLLSSITDVIDGSRTWLHPGLIAIDAYSRGCAGTTIALGLRDLGIDIPIVLVRQPGEPLPITSSDPMLHVVDSAAAERAVSEIVCSSTPPFAEELDRCSLTSISRNSSRAA